MIEFAGLATAIAAAKCLRAVLPYLRAPFIPPQGKYVMVTGCTDGIGKQYAKYMSDRGIPLVLVGRNRGKLDSLQKELAGSQGHKVLEVDFSHQNLDYNRFAQALASLQIQQRSISGIINCSGTALITKFSQIPWQQIQSLKRSNTVSLELSLKTLDSPLLSDSPFLINLSSYTAHYPLKYSSVYSATKAYLSNLLEAYALENGKERRVLSVQPWYVSTKMTGYRKGWDCVRAEEVVEGSLRVLGSRTSCAGTIKHELIREFGYLLEKFYFPAKIEENFERVRKLKELKLKRSLRKPGQQVKKQGQN